MLYWEKQSMDCFGIKSYLQIMRGSLPNQHEEYCGLIDLTPAVARTYRFGWWVFIHTQQVFIFTILKMVCLCTWQRCLDQVFLGPNLSPRLLRIYLL